MFPENEPFQQPWGTTWVRHAYDHSISNFKIDLPALIAKNV